MLNRIFYSLLGEKSLFYTEKPTKYRRGKVVSLPLDNQERALIRVSRLVKTHPIRTIDGNLRDRYEVWGREEQKQL
jgi:hypothetical protein